ncbi:MAG: FixH family protein [Zoogloea sp.]|nr:FixH family protein [Zoogloea sp.]
MQFNDKDASPWYRQPWPWALMLMPAIAVVAGSVTAWLAVKSNDGLVADDYYKQGLAINQTLDRGILARTLGFSAQVRVSADKLGVQLSARPGVALPHRLIVTFSHPTRAGLDQVVRLEGQNGRYEGAMQVQTAGRWQILIEDESRSWRLTGTALLPAETEIRIDSPVVKPVD